MCAGMRSWLREKLFAGSDYGTNGLYSKGIYIAAAVAFDMGLRPGKVRRVDGDLSQFMMIIRVKEDEPFCLR